MSRMLGRYLIILLAVCMPLLAGASVSASVPTETSDSTGISTLPDDLLNLSQISRAEEGLEDIEPDRNWWHLLKQGRLDLSDPSVEYPRFLGFCVKVYNWGDRTFNSYDEDYVVGTGRRWKARITNENWVDSHAMDFKRDMSMRFMSNITSTLGAYLQYMAVSIGYSLDMSNIIGNEPSNHKKLSLGFNCARFNIEAYYQENTGGSYIRKFGKYNNGRLFKMEFPGLSFYQYGIDGYYFFNNRKYSQGAAYNFSKIQKKSAGSAMIGFSFTSVNNSLDFSTLPQELLPYFNLNRDFYRFHYKSYCLLGGYGYNFVIGRHSLVNVTVMPRFGAAHCYEDSIDGASWLMSMGFIGKSSYTYNLNDFFICVAASIDGHWYKKGPYSLFTSVENVSASVGVRF